MKQKRSCDQKNTKKEATENRKTKIQDHKLESKLLHPAGLVKQDTPYCPRALSAYAFNKLTIARRTSPTLAPSDPPSKPYWGTSARRRACTVQKRRDRTIQESGCTSDPVQVRPFNTVNGQSVGGTWDRFRERLVAERSSVPGASRRVARRVKGGNDPRGARGGKSSCEGEAGTLQETSVGQRARGASRDISTTLPVRRDVGLSPVGWEELEHLQDAEAFLCDAPMF